MIAACSHDVSPDSGSVDDLAGIDEAVIPPDLISIPASPCPDALPDGGGCSGADLVACLVRGICTAPGGPLTATTCNRGTAPTAAPVAGAFYRRDPSGMHPELLCVAWTRGALAPAECQMVTCPTTGSVDGNLYFRANDDGWKAPVEAECDATNDIGRLLYSCSLQ